MRERIYNIIAGSDTKAGRIYDVVMIAAIIISLIPLAFKEPNTAFLIMDKITVAIFIIDYFFRLITADYYFGKKGAASFIKYPFTFMAIIDFLSILPSLTILDSSVKLLRLFRMVMFLRVLRVIKFVRYSKNLEIIGKVIKETKEPLLAVGTLALGYIFVSALVIFNVEPESFGTYFDAVYWATVSLTTVGYGDLYPITTLGRLIAMIASLFGIAIVALPAGIITAGYMRIIQTQKDESKEEEQKPEQTKQ